MFDWLKEAALPAATTGARVRRGALHCFAVCLVAMLAACGGGGDDIPSDAQALVAAEVDDGRASALAFGIGDTTDAANIHVKALLPVGFRRVTWNTYEYDYRIVLRNDGPTVDGVKVHLVKAPAGIQVIDGTFDVGTLAGGKLSTPTDTITIRKPLFNLFILRTHEWKVTLGPPTITGVAAVGAALAYGEVDVTDGSGANVCAESPVNTTPTGAFTCTVQAGRTAPFVVVVNDPFKFYPPLVSMVPTAPQPGTTLVVNATPITTAIVAQLAPDGDAASVVADRSLIDLAALNAITTNLLTQIGPVLSALGAPQDYNPFTTQIVAGTLTQGGNTADQVVETLRFSTVNGVSVVATVDNPGGAVPVADPSKILSAPSPTLQGLTDSLRLIVNSLATCFALPVDTRVLAFDNSIASTQGGPEVTSMAPACRAITHPDYLNGGYRMGQRFYGLLRDPSMVGAAFSPAEIMLFEDDPTASDQDLAVANLRYVDSNGVAGNLIEVLRKLPGSATAAHPSDWWPYGNQQVVDSSIRSYARRAEQLADTSMAPFVNASRSNFAVGIELNVNKDGPGSAGLRAARITGPGLPPAGLVYTRPDPSLIASQFSFNILRKDGKTAPADTPRSTTGSTVFLLQRTEGITSDAPIRPNPFAGSETLADGTPANEAFMNWAHPLDYGKPAGSMDYVDFSTLRANTTYVVEFYYVGETTPRYSYKKTMLTPVTPAGNVANLRWHDLTAQSLRYLDPLDPLAAPQASMDLTWTEDPFAEPLRAVGVLSFGLTLGVNQSVNVSFVPLARGATSATVDAPTPAAAFPALTSDGSSMRSILLKYRTLDGSFKESSTRYN